MSVGKKILFGSLGWVLGGPIGAIIGYYLASSGDQAERSHFSQTASGIYPSTKPGDFMVSLMVLQTFVATSIWDFINSGLTRF